MKTRTCSGCGSSLANLSYAAFRTVCDRCEPEYEALRYRALKAVNRAVRNGLLPKINTQACVDCGSNAHHYDHRNYHKPLEVAPVCGSCNQLRGPAVWNIHLQVM